MAKRFLYLLEGAGIFISFVLFSYLVHKNLFTQFDFNMTVRLQDHLPRRFDTLFSLLSIIGNVEVVSIFLIGIVALQTFLRRKWRSIFFFAGFVMIHIFELYGKFFVNHKPPPQFMLRTQHPIQFPQFYVSAQNSYPSGHAARAAFISVVIYFFTVKGNKLSLNSKMAIIAFVLVYDFLMVVSRVYLGEHWTSDIIGGLLLGASFAFAIGFVY